MKRKPTRLLLIQGDLVAVYDGKEQIAVFGGAKLLDKESAEQLRQVPTAKLKAVPVAEEEAVGE